MIESRQKGEKAKRMHFTLQELQEKRDAETEGYRK